MIINQTYLFQINYFYEILDIKAIFYIIHIPNLVFFLLSFSSEMIAKSLKMYITKLWYICWIAKAKH